MSRKPKTQSSPSSEPSESENDGNPVDGYFKFASARDQGDFDTWKQWADQGRDPGQVEPLMNRFMPRLKRKESLLRAPNVQPAAFQAEVMKQSLKAFNTYDPTKNTSLNTHLENQLRKVQRFVNKNQNVGYIPEDTSYQIGKVNRAQDELHDQFGRPPTEFELSQHMGLPVKQVKNVLSSQRKDVPTSMLEADTNIRTISRDREVLPHLQDELKPDEAEVFGYLYGQGGKPTITSTNALAKKLGKSPSQISRIRTRISKKYQEFK